MENIKQLEDIAKRLLGIDTLETRNADILDFHDVAVWNLKGALLEAYKLGQESKKK